MRHGHTTHKQEMDGISLKLLQSHKCSIRVKTAEQDDGVARAYLQGSVVTPYTINTAQTLCMHLLIVYDIVYVCVCQCWERFTGL